MKRRSVPALLTALAISALVSIANAGFETKDGKELTKGEVIKILVNDPKAEIYKKDRVMFDDRRGTVKTAPKD
jgi:hypothetical protein